MANKPDTATAGVFINSLSSSAEYKVYSNNMDNESFIGHPDYLDYVLKNSKSGFFALDSQVDDADICKVYFELNIMCLKMCSLHGGDFRNRFSVFGLYVMPTHG